MDEIIKLLQSDDFKDRTKGEYYLLVDKITKLENMLKKYKEGELEFKPNCPYGLLKDQLYYMTKYKEILEERAVIEKMDF